MSEQEYYKKDLDLLKERASKCNEELINSLLFFLGETNTHTTGISQDIEKEIRDIALEFKKKCSCQHNPWKKIDSKLL